MKTLNLILSGLLLGSLLACGGGGGGGSTPTPPTNPYATSLSYTDPGGTSTYRLVRNTTQSTATRLVLDLYGPTGQTARGLSFFLSADTSKVAFVHPSGSGSSVISAGSVFTLGTEPRLLKDKLTESNANLQVGIFQKGGSAITYGASPILSLALNLNGSSVPKGTVTFQPQSGKNAVELKGDNTTGNVTLSVGTLSAQ